MNRYIDLHMHTNCSDGIPNPAELLALVRRSDVVAFSVTDHDTFEGCQAIKGMLVESDPELISGIELSVAIYAVTCVKLMLYIVRV